MILRIWHGLVPSERVEEYADLLRRTGIAGYRETPGNLDAQVVHRDRADGTAEVLTLSWWASLADVRAFTGADVEAARRYPEDDAFLLGHRPEVRHYEVEP